MIHGDWGIALSEVRDGKREFADVFEAIYREMKIYFLRQLGDLHTADDLASDVLVKVYLYLVSLRDNPRAWVYKIAQNVKNDYLREKNRKRMVSTINVRFQDIDVLDSRETETRAYYREIVCWALNQLPEEDREIIAMRYLDGMTLIEIAETLGISKSTAHVRIDKAIEKLRRICKSHGINVLEDIDPLDDEILGVHR